MVCRLLRLLSSKLRYKISLEMLAGSWTSINRCLTRPRGSCQQELVGS